MSRPHHGAKTAVMTIINHLVGSERIINTCFGIGKFTIVARELGQMSLVK